MADGVAVAILAGTAILVVGVIVYDKLEGLPPDGPLDGSLSEDNGKGKGKIRDYDSDGRAKCDYDIGHPPSHGPDPHAHDWDWSTGKPARSHPGRDLNPGE